ncbi:hypothetical protein BCR34DRAFT_250516 [Clohesyomyces aquaticus]|uniref:Uncharacterized protein n=1 Tax=Clohesyomyces aquaticus TaxID=1231657 RepID=A0A1Y1Y559_9PLEO|nr:hypothetical protein BCR34DRAFT_250516 [Clohesyomyces aquaticus]
MNMTTANHYTYSARAAPTASIPAVSRRASTQKEHKTVEDEDVAQGRIFWLPLREDLPERAVKRAHGKGAIEEGIYNHPIVILSRLAADRYIVHFQLITYFQGKRLDEIYGKANEFHASRRSWDLPIALAPDHPDATSKKSKKRFLTLDLAGKATLR